MSHKLLDLLDIDLSVKLSSVLTHFYCHFDQSYAFLLV